MSNNYLNVTFVKSIDWHEDNLECQMISATSEVVPKTRFSWWTVFDD